MPIQSIGSQCYWMCKSILFVSSKFHAWWMGIIEQKIVYPPNGVFTCTKMQAFPQTMFSTTPINISSALTERIKPTEGTFTFLFHVD